MQSPPAVYPEDWIKSYFDSTITLMITPPYSGWVTLVFVGTPRGGVTAVDCSAVYDPFPALGRWIHKIASNDLPAVARVNEEGCIAVLCVRPIPGREEWVELQINRCGESELGKGDQRFLCRAERRQLVHELFRRFEQWQREDCKGLTWPKLRTFPLRKAPRREPEKSASPHRESCNPR